MKIQNTEDFIIEAKKVHGDKYDYSKVDFINMSTKVTIICPVHGEFEQTPKAHIRNGYGCRKCGRDICSSKLKTSNDEFIEKAKSIHGYRYDYSKVEYVNSYKPVSIVCKEHGVFEQVPHDHLKGAGCPKCGLERVSNKIRLKNDEFIARANKIHNGFYSYDRCDVDQRDENGKVIITCPIHGDFKMTPKIHLYGKGCPKCGYQKIRMAQDEFIKQANIVHNNKYSYEKVEYSDTDSKVIITCPIHGDFEQTSHSHLSGHGCPVCGKQLSKAENDIYEYCCNLIGKDKIEQRNRTEIKPYELDIYIPSLKSAIKYNGLRWHSEKFNKDKNYHLEKLNLCKNSNIKLLQVFEDEYVNNKDIVFNKIKHILKIGEDLPKIPGRKCIIKEIGFDESKTFLNKYHIQGYFRSTIYLGAFYNDELIGVMAFKRELKDNNNWELTRFASNYNYICQGVGGKLFKYFIRNYEPEEIKSFADRRWTIDEENNIYLQLGFVFDGYTKPDYHYYKDSDGCIRQHKFGFRKIRLHNKYGLPLSMTESEMTEKLGYTKIWDCGLIRYVWRKKKNE